MMLKLVALSPLRSAALQVEDRFLTNLRANFLDIAICTGGLKAGEPTVSIKPRTIKKLTF